MFKKFSASLECVIIYLLPSIYCKTLWSSQAISSGRIVYFLSIQPGKCISVALLDKDKISI